ncbi:MAG: D-glycero-beta-D-manno-heptose-7-phosphate kinase [Akkermansia sp.]
MNRLSSYINRFPQVGVLCIGDIMLDKFLYGSVDRISPEAPVPVLKMSKTKQMLGGAGNAAANLCTLGCRTHFLGIIGQDATGKLVRKLMDDIHCQAMLIEEPDYTTTVKVRYVTGNHHMLRVDEEQRLQMTPALTKRLLDEAQSILPDVDVVLLSDYGKGLISEQTMPRLIELCRSQGKVVIVDPKSSDYSIYRGASLVKPNLKEFNLATGLSLKADSPDFTEQAIAGARKIFEEFEIDNLLITLSEHGMIFIPATHPNNYVRISTEAQEVFDVSGAGDTSLAVLGASIATGAPMDKAMEIANVASGIVVGKFGTASVTREELNTALNERNRKESSWQHRKNIVTPDQAVEIIRQLKKDNKTVGFTNGCFDILHIGHLYSFMKAKDACDILFVGLNTDASVKRLKGDSRPINDEHMRSLLLASLDFIDYVVLFDEDTALPLIDKLRPDVIAKEGYPLDRWPEGQFVVAYGGTALELPRLEGFSTSGIIAKINCP